jgi:hypothetical protein
MNERKQDAGLKNKTTTYRKLLLLLLLLFVSGGSTCPRRIQNNTNQSPVAFAQPPSLEQVAATINNNTHRVQRLQATGASLRISGFPSLRTSLALERPLRFRMQAGLGLTGTELDLGSNDDVFWMWAKRSEPPVTYFARHSEYDAGAAREILPVPPHWLIEALGLVEIQPNDNWSGPRPLGNGRVEIRGVAMTPSGPLTKVLVVDDQRGIILEQQVYDQSGQLLATAIASQHHFDAQNQVTMPRQVAIQLPPAQLAFTLEVDGYQINNPNGGGTTLWTMPQVPGSQLVPLAAVIQRVGAQPTMRGQQSVGWNSGKEFMPR